MGQPLPPKKDVVLALLERATVFIHVDPRRQGCVVPMNFKQQPKLVLQIGLNMAVSIPDLRVDDTGISCTLSFGGRGFWCSMPWSCVYGMVADDGRSMVWPDDLPPEVRANTKQEAAKAAESAPTQDAQTPKRAPKKAAAAKAKPEKKVAKTTAAPAKKKAAPKRAAKKPEPLPEPADIRRRLVAVKKQEPAAEPARETAERQAPETPAPVGQRKPKRELPPYLRVVK